MPVVKRTRRRQRVSCVRPESRSRPANDDRIDPSQHQRIVDVALALNRHMWKVRAQGLTVAEALLLESTEPSVAHHVTQIRECMETLRRVWPRLSDVEIVDVTLVITQAASRALSIELQRKGRS